MSRGKEFVPIHSKNITKKDLQIAIRAWKILSGSIPTELVDQYAGAIAFLQEQYEGGNYKDESIVKRLFGFWGERKEKQRLETERREKVEKEKECLRERQYKEEHKKGQEKFIEEHTLGSELSVASKTGWCIHHPEYEENTEWDSVGVPQSISGFHQSIIFAESKNSIENYNFIKVNRREREFGRERQTFMIYVGEEDTYSTYINIQMANFIFVDPEDSEKVILNVWNEVKEKEFYYDQFSPVVNKLKIIGQYVLEYDPELKNKTKIVGFEHAYGQTIYFRIGILNKGQNPQMFEIREVRPKQSKTSNV